MTTKRTLLLLALFLAVVVVGPGARGQSTRQVGGFVAQVPANRTAPPRRPAPPPVAPGTRRLPLDSLEVVQAPTLAALLRPTDQVLEVVFPSASTTDSPHDTEEEAAERLSGHRALATVRLLRKESALAPDGKAIFTTLTVDVMEVLKDTTGRLVADSSIELQQFGGEVTIGNQRVVLRSLDVRPLEIGRIYLAVLDPDQEGELLFSANSIEMDGNTAKALRLDYPSPVTARSADWIKGEMRKRRRR